MASRAVVAAPAHAVLMISREISGAPASRRTPRLTPHSDHSEDSLGYVVGATGGAFLGILVGATIGAMHPR